MADRDRIIEIIIETNDRTGGALGAMQNKLLAFDRAVLRTQERLKRMTSGVYQTSINLIDRVTPQGSRINSMLKSIANKAYNATVGLIDRTAGGIRELEAKLMQITGKAYNVTVGLKNQATQGVKNIADGALMGMGGMGLSMLGGAGIGYGVVNAFQSQMDFEKQMSSVKAIMGTEKANAVISVDADTGKAMTAMDALIAKAEEMGATTKFTAGEAAQGLYYMGMAGWTTEQMVAGLPNVLNLAAAGNESLARTSDIVTDSMTGFHLKAGTMIKDSNGQLVEASAHYSDAMAALITNANTDINMAGETLKYVSGVVGGLYADQSDEAKMQAADDTLMMTGLMANSGIKASQSGTAQKALLTRLSAMNRNAEYARSVMGVDMFDQETGQTRRLRDVIGEMRKKFNEGMSGEEQLALFERLSGNEFRKDTRDKLGGLLGRVMQNGGKFTAQDKMMLNTLLEGQEAMSGWMGVMFADEEDWEKMADAMDNCAGKAEEMSKIQLDNLAGDFTMLGSAWDAFQRSFVKGKASEGLRDFIQSVTEMVSKAEKLFRDGIQIGDFGTILGDVFSQLKNKALAFDGIGSILAGGALIGAFAKITQKAKGLIDLLTRVRDLASFSRIPSSNNPPPSTSPSPNAAQSGAAGTAASRVATMNVTANVVNLNGRTAPNGTPSSNSSNNPRPSGSPSTGNRGNTGTPPPPAGNPPPSSSGWRGRVGVGVASAALPLALGALDMHSTAQYNQQTAAEAQYEVDLATENLQKAQESGDTQAISQAEQALADSAKYQRETLKYNRERELKSTGSMAGSTIGAIAGGMLGGPVGAMIGGMIGEAAGNYLGGLYAQHVDTDTNAQSPTFEQAKLEIPKPDWMTHSGKMYSELSATEKMRYRQNQTAEDKAAELAANQKYSDEVAKVHQETVVDRQLKSARAHNQDKSREEIDALTAQYQKEEERKRTNFAIPTDRGQSATALSMTKDQNIEDIKNVGLESARAKIKNEIDYIKSLFGGRDEPKTDHLGMETKPKQSQSIQEANQLGTDFWSSIKDSVIGAFTAQETQTSTGQQDHLGFEMPEMKLPDFNLSQWWEEQTAGITMPDFSQMWADFNVSDFLPDIDVSGWFNEAFASIELPDLSSLLPDFSSLGETISESLSGIPTAASDTFNSISTAANEGWTKIQTEWSQLPSFFDGLWAGAGSAASSAGSAIANGINSAIGTIQSAWEGLSSWLSAKISSLSSMASNAASSVRGFFGGGGGEAAKAEGGFLTAPQHILAGEAGPEVIIPLSVGRRNRARDLLAKTLNIVNGGASAAGFGSNEKLQINSAQEVESSDRSSMAGNFISSSYENLTRGGSIAENLTPRSDFPDVNFESLKNKGLQSNINQDFFPTREGGLSTQEVQTNMPEFAPSDDETLPSAGEMPISNTSSTNSIGIDLGGIAPTFNISGSDNPQAVMETIINQLEDISDLIGGTIAEKLASIHNNQGVTA